MAIMIDEERRRTWIAAMRSTVNLSGIPNVDKTELRAAIDATDAWIDSNQATFNQALPLTFRQNANLTQKTLLFCYVAMRRAGLLKVEEDGAG